MTSKYKYKYLLLLILFLISFTSSLILSLEPETEICTPGEGCGIVKNSQYNYTIGIKNSYYGTIIFAILSVITLSQMIKPKKFKKNIITIGLIIGSIISLYFLYLQQFVLKAYCKYCLIIDFSIILSLIIILAWKENEL